MTRRWIVVGDKLAGGGVVVSGSLFTDINGYQVARVGDKAICSLHGPTTIASGDPTIIIDGSPVARERDCCACGCQLISTRQFSTFIEDMHGDGGSQIFAVAPAQSEPLSQEVSHTHFNEGAAPPNPQKALDVVQAANEALLDAKAFRPYDTELEAAQEWRRIVLPIANSPEFGVEVGTKISRSGDKYFLGASFSTGSADSCDGLLEKGHEAPGTRTAYIHTHPYSPGFIGRNRAFKLGDKVTSGVGGINKPGGDVRGDLVVAYSIKINAYIAEPNGLIRWDYNHYIQLQEQVANELAIDIRHVELGAAESRH